MPRSVEEAERDLEALGKRVRAGWAKRHPAKQEHRAAVRRALIEQMKDAKPAAEEQIKEVEQKQKEANEQQEQKQQRHRY